MELSELRKKPHLSASGVNEYIECGLLYRFGRIDRLPKEFLNHRELLKSRLWRSPEVWKLERAVF